MVVGGYHKGDVLNNVEIISSDPANRCSDLVSKVLPDSSNLDKGKGQGMLGAFTKRAAIVCGGNRINSGNITNECFEYKPKSNR
jgi:hypothetical protein